MSDGSGAIGDITNEKIVAQTGAPPPLLESNETLTGTACVSGVDSTFTWIRTVPVAVPAERDDWLNESLLSPTEPPTMV